MKNSAAICLTIACLLAVSSALAELQLPSIFTRDMVLQRDQPVRVWGKATPGSTVTVEFSGQVKTAMTNAAGNWLLELQAMSASSNPQDMQISSSGDPQSKTITNILVGDVWICSGQSNMEFPLFKSAYGEEALQKPENISIRFFKQRFDGSPGPRFDSTEGHWKIDAPGGRKWLSAVAWNFAQKVFQSEQVPVAMVTAYIGGSSAQMWTPIEDLLSDPAFQYYVKRYEEYAANFEERKAAYLLRKAEVEASGARLPITGHYGWFPSATYNAMLHPIQNFAVKGVIWYQGEANTDPFQANLYRKLFPAMIRSWRREFKNPEMPFLFVQLPNYDAPANREWATLRESQAMTARQVKNTGMAVTIDLGDSGDVHPVLKKPVGERLAAIALREVHGRPVDCYAPEVTIVQANGAEVILQFDGDLTLSNGQSPLEFEISGADQSFVPAMAELDGRTIRVHSESVADPRIVRYAWTNSPKVNLFGVNSLPVAPFEAVVPVRGGKPNILFIIGDDMRMQHACYGYDYMKTPNLDQLAEEGVLFTRAYVQQGICAPSRASFLTGCRPDTTGVDFPYTRWYAEEFLKEHPSIMRYFHDRGWYTKTYQKVHHGAVEQGFSEPNMKGKYELWTMPEAVSPYTREYGEAPRKYRNSYYDKFWGHMEEIRADGRKVDFMQVYREYMLPWDCGTKPDGTSADDTGYVAGQNVEDAIEVMNRAAKKDQPFFIALGMANTHYPFISPKKYWDLYSGEDLHFAMQDTLAEDLYQGQLHSDARSKYAGWQKRGEETEEYKSNLLHGYYAAVSYQDALMGRMFNHLKAIGQWDNTIICVIGDHGYHLGEHSHWGKYSCFEVGLRTTMMWKPQTAARFTPGTQSGALVEFVDLYPTFLDLTGHEPDDYLEGLSVVPLFENPELPWKTAAFSQKVLYHTPNGSRGEGYSVRTDRYRYTEWRADWETGKGARQGELLGNQLFDLESDPDETHNLAGRPEHAERISALSLLLQDRNSWQTCLPEGYLSNADNPHGVDSIYANPEKGAPYNDEPKIIPAFKSNP